MKISWYLALWPWALRLVAVGEFCSYRGPIMVQVLPNVSSISFVVLPRLFMTISSHWESFLGTYAPIGAMISHHVPLALVLIDLNALPPSTVFLHSLSFSQSFSSWNNNLQSNDCQNSNRRKNFCCYHLCFHVHCSILLDIQVLMDKSRPLSQMGPNDHHLAIYLSICARLVFHHFFSCWFFMLFYFPFSCQLYEQL